MNVIDSVFKTQWGAGRWLRLLIGAAVLMDAYYESSGLVAVLGGFLVYQSLFDLGCSAGNCSSHDSKKHPYDFTHNFKNVNKQK